MSPGARLFGIGGFTAFTTLALLSMVPSDRYIQWQATRTEAFARLGWIYERIHFDPAPIDVAFIGTSHTMNGIDGEAVATAMGGCPDITNLSIPSYGRNLHWLIARELLEHRTVGTLVVEVVENETRRSHPLFHAVARWRDIVQAPMLLNLRYLNDLALLPLDRLLLGVKTLLPAAFGLHRRFDPAQYDGPDPDNTRMVRVHNQAFTGPRTTSEDPAALDRDAWEERADKRYNMLPPALADLEYAVPLHYLRQIETLAASRHVPLVFLYLPSYGQDTTPHDPAPYAGHPMLTVSDLLTPHAAWHDFAHLNAAGAAAVSARVGHLLATAARLADDRCG